MTNIAQVSTVKCVASLIMPALLLLVVAVQWSHLGDTLAAIIDKGGPIFFAVELAACVVWIFRYTMPCIKALMAKNDNVSIGPTALIWFDIQIPAGKITGVSSSNGPFIKAVDVRAGKRRYRFSTIPLDRNREELLQRIAVWRDELRAD